MHKKANTSRNKKKALNRNEETWGKTLTQRNDKQFYVN